MTRIWIVDQYASLPRTGVRARPAHLARELVALGHEVTVIAAAWTHLHAADVDPKKLPYREEFEGFTFVHVPVPRYRDAHDKRRILNWLLFSAKITGLPGKLGHEPDVVMASSPSPFPFLGAERLARRVGARLVFEVRDIWPLSVVEIGGFPTSHPGVRVMQWVEDRAYRNSDAVISNLPNAVEHMVSRGMPKEKFTWVPNGFSARDLSNAEALPAETAAQFPNDKFVVGYAGTVGKANALDTLIDAAAELRSEPDVEIAIVGQGREKAQLQERVRHEGIDNVRFLPPVPKAQVGSVIEQFDACYVGLLPESVFRFGIASNKLFDYLAAGQPIIYAIDSGPYRPVEEYRCGIQVPPQSARDVADAILRLKSKSAEERAAMGERGRKAAFEFHDYANIAKKLETVLVPGS